MKPDEEMTDALEAGPLTRAWIAACAETEDDADTRAVEGGLMTLTEEDLKQVRNGVISALTHSADVAAFLAAGMRAVLADAGVLTERTLTPDTGSEPVRQQFENVAYAAGEELVRKGRVVAGPHPPEPKK